MLYVNTNEEMWEDAIRNWSGVPADIAETVAQCCADRASDAYYRAVVATLAANGLNPDDVLTTNSIFRDWNGGFLGSKDVRHSGMLTLVDEPVTPCIMDKCDDAGNTAVGEIVKDEVAYWQRVDE